MLRLCRLRLAVVTGGAAAHAATTLNSLLDISQGKNPVPHDELKSFLKETVMPVLAGTEVDRRGNSTALRHHLAQLTRDAAFAALVLKARPDAGFVQSITTCIKEDNQRMRFVSKMTSAQACKTIEHLCRVGVRDEALFPVLIAQLNYSNLQEMARVMLSFAEAGLHEQNILVVVPLYCGDMWEAEVQTTTTSRSSEGDVAAISSFSQTGKELVRSSNVFEAVRVLRALSKSCRACEAALRDAAAGSSSSSSATMNLAELPRESLNFLRNNLLKFLFENGKVLRGAHWVNTARALLYFPPEMRLLRELNVVCPLIAEEAQAAANWARKGTGSTHPSTQHSSLTCEEVAAVAIGHVFDYVEHRTPLSTSSEGHPCAAFPFDLVLKDLVKLFPIMEQCAAAVPGQAALQATRLATAMHFLSTNAQQLAIEDVVKVLQTLRRLPPSTEASAAVQVCVAEVSVRLARSPPERLMQQLSFPLIIQIAATISALRVTKCDGFLSFLCGAVALFPRSLTVETTLTFANALANVANEKSASCHSTMKALLVRLTRNYQSELQSAPLVSLFPHTVTKIVRACVLIDYIPDADVLSSLLGSRAVPMAATPEVQAAGGALVFGLTRSVAHFARQAVRECPGRVEELWVRGVMRCLLPMSVACAQHAEAQARASKPGDVPAYTAVAWRTTMEMVAAFADVTFDSMPAEETARRVVEAVPLCIEMLKSAAATTSLQLEQQGRHSSSASELRSRVQAITFNSNCCVHFLSSLLMLEYLVYQCAAQVQMTKGRSLPDELKVQLTKLRDVAYAGLLRAPLLRGSATMPDTAMDVARCIFAYPVATPHAVSPPSTAVLLRRQDALEITTNLPFALSLIMHPGPVNEYFTEHCMSLMVADDDNNGDT